MTTKPTTTTTDAPAAEKQPAKTALPAPKAGEKRVKIWVDGCFSSLGEHRKGEVVCLPEGDAAIMIEQELVQEC